MPKQPAPVVGASDQCALCGRATSERTDDHCLRCWDLRQLLTAYVPLLLASEAAPKVRAMLKRALESKAEEPAVGPA